MEQFRRYIFAGVTMAVALLPIMLAGCAKSDLSGDDNGGSMRTALSITVTDDGYVPAAGEQPQTRATENGYKTEFTAGDKIGLYTLKDGAVVDANICLTATDNGNGGLSWVPPGEEKVWYYNESTTYYAYYPYQANMTNKVVETGTNAADFFKPLTDGWTPATDQSTYDKYTAQDLMTGTGTVGGSKPTQTLAVNLTHRMALAVVKTPATVKFALSTDANYTWTSTVSNLTLSGFTPYKMGTDVYRYLVKPANSSQPQLSGSYKTPTNGTRKFVFTPKDIALGKYKTYIVDGNPISYTLQVGDFYMKDGSLAEKDVTLTDAQKSACVGIVLKVGKDAGDDCVYKQKNGTTSMNTIHGYVLALHDANGGNACTWGPIGTEVGTGGEMTDYYKYYRGYAETQKIKKMPGYSQSTYPAAYWTTDGYETIYPAPAGSSGWFLPSIMQWGYWSNNTDLLLTQVKKAIGDSSYSWKSYYWSSSEYFLNPSERVWYVELNFNTSVPSFLKTESCPVRAFLAF